MLTRSAHPDGPAGRARTPTGGAPMLATFAAVAPAAVRPLLLDRRAQVALAALLAVALGLLAGPGEAAAGYRFP